MAGICGFLNISGKSDNKYVENTVNRMSSSLYNSFSGPLFDDGFCAAIKSDCFAENNSKAVFFYGELYNKEQLCVEYNTAAENEASFILNTNAADNFTLLEKLSGKYVFVVYDKNRKELKIIRDKIGSKPMYYYKTDECFVFSTELKSLLASDIVPRRIDKSALSRFLQLTYIPAPACIIENVKKARQASVCSVDACGRICENGYWDFIPKIKDEYKDFEVCKATLKETLCNSVREKMALYPNNGAFLSGGFDSSIVVSIMARICEKSVNTFTIGYDNKQFDESSLAAIVANKNGTKHHVLNLDYATVKADMETVLNGLDEPYADSSLIATFAVCKLAKQYVDVAFMGDAGDELFAGYNKYLISYYGGKYKKIPRWLRKYVIEPLTKLIPSKSRLRRKINKVVLSADMPVFEQRKRLMCLGFKPEELQNLMLDGYVDALDFIKEDYDFLRDSDEQTRAQYVDLKTVLEGDMLPKVEIACKLSGLKTCAPILDDRIIKLAYGIPTEFKINKTNRKIILKETFRDILPDELFSAPKHGFAVPIGEWLEGELKTRLMTYADKDFLAKQGLFSSDYISRIIDEHFSHKKDRYSELWAFFVFQSWYEKNAL